MLELAWREQIELVPPASHAVLERPAMDFLTNARIVVSKTDETPLSARREVAGDHRIEPIDVIGVIEVARFDADYVQHAALRFNH